MARITCTALILVAVVANAAEPVWQWDNAASPDADLGKLHGRARIGPNFELLLDHGSFHSACKVTGEFTIELHATSFKTGGEILRLGELKLTTFFDQLPKSAHLVVTHQTGKTVAYLNGKPIKATSGDLKLGEELVFGEAWSGAVEAITVHARVLDPDQIQSNANKVSRRVGSRPALLPSRVMAKLVESTIAPKVDELHSYDRALVENIFDIERHFSGPDIEAKRIVVWQWVIMDRKPLKRSLKVGDSVTLSLEPISKHPQLKGELRRHDHAEFDSPAFYDLGSHEP